MYKAAALKEFREILGIALLALAAYGLLVSGTMDPDSPLNIFVWLHLANRGGTCTPFIGDDFRGMFLLISVVFALALGLRQSLGESIRGTYPFLLHRPADRCRLIGIKLLLGTIVYLICAGLPILIYGAWAATPGTHASPFEWSMTVPTWIAWLAMTILYLGAFHTAIRPGRWYGSRCLPLAASALATFAAAGLAFEFEGSLWPCLIVLVVDVWLIAMILFAARTRDYP